MNSKKKKIYLAHSSKYDYQANLYQPIKSSNLNNEYEFTYLLDQPIFLPNTKETIKSFDAVVAEIGYPSTGAGIEIGWADAFRVPLVLIHSSEYQPATYYKELTEYIIAYNSNADMIAKLQDTLSLLFKR